MRAQGEIPLFEERQAFLPRPIGLVLLFALLAVLAGSWPLYSAALPGAKRLLLALPVAAVALMVVMELRVAVLPGRVEVAMVPLMRRTFAAAEILSAEARTYRPIREYGGWGIRRGRSGWAYNVSGDRGVQLELSDGRRVLLGSRRAEELVEAIRTIRPPRP